MTPDINISDILNQNPVAAFSLENPIGLITLVEEVVCESDYEPLISSNE